MINKIYKSALITGAGDGIGYETLKRFLKEKIAVYALDKNVKKLKILQKKFKFNIIELDLTDTNKLYKELSKLKIDILFANAGIGRGAEGILKASRDDIEISTKINMESCLHTLKAVVQNGKEQKRTYCSNGFSFWIISSNQYCLWRSKRSYSSYRPKFACGTKWI